MDLASCCHGAGGARHRARFVAHGEPRLLRAAVRALSWRPVLGFPAPHYGAATLVTPRQRLAPHASCAPVSRAACRPGGGTHREHRGSRVRGAVGGRGGVLRLLRVRGRCGCGPCPVRCGRGGPVHSGGRHVLGPVSLTTNDEVGLLVDGFDSRPMVLSPYNAPYYARLVEAAGYAPRLD